VKTIAVTTLHELAVLAHLSSKKSCRQKKPNATHKPVTWLVKPYQSFCVYANTRIGHLRNNSRTFTKRLIFLWFMNLVFSYCASFLNFNFYYSYIINFMITILLSLFLPSSLSLCLLCCNPLFSLLTNLSAPSHPLFPIFNFSPLLPPTCHHTTPPSYTHNPLTSLLYLLYTNPAPCNP
jgi:hypothetical protein